MKESGLPINSSQMQQEDVISQGSSSDSVQLLIAPTNNLDLVDREIEICSKFGHGYEDALGSVG